MDRAILRVFGYLGVKLSSTIIAEVADLSHDGKGVVKVDGKVYFVPGALAGEEIEFTAFKKRRGKFEGRLEKVIEPSKDRIVPECEYFGVCGGCSLQHLDPDMQLVFKRKVLNDNLTRIGKVTPMMELDPISGDKWHYRRKARPGAKYVPKKGGMMVGFREQGNSYLTSLRHCRTLDKRLSDLLDPLHEVIGRLSCYQQIPQVEVAAGDNGVGLILRHLQALLEEDLEILTAFAKEHAVQFYLQSGGPKTVVRLWPVVPEPLFYELHDYDLKLIFSAADFVQVNKSVNELMIAQALEHLALSENDRVLDLFCGLGNFTLPMARSGAYVLGVEGDQFLVNKGKANALDNGIDNAHFEKLDLQGEGIKHLAESGFNKLLLDPPRSGALQVVTDLVPVIQPEVIVYVSCNPATLARDAEVLVHQLGYTMSHAGAIDMFPHTAHIESMGVFVR